MKLKKIILKGFKSFPEKTELEFNDGVTAIVGPNGSGKSNIIEAIRWVMGEQSAKTLRGGRMNDVIFSGTNKLQPLNIAEVELILDNSDQYLNIDFEEVSILRRLSRNDGSTYMINQQECLLRDIIDLFMDSGLGKESFSIISQGQVEAVFNSKPEDRRSIFEEAAGVYKYKIRKQDAENKLEETQDNLDRIQDILYELEAQLNPLKKQAKNAQIYLDQREQLTELDIGVTVWQIKNLNEKIQFDQKQNREISKELTTLESEIENLEEKQKTSQNDLATVETLRDELNNKMVNLVREKERTEASLNLFDEKIRHQEVFIKEKNNSIKHLKSQNHSYNKELESMNEKYTAKNDEVNQLKTKIKKIEEQNEFLEGNKEIQLEELREKYIVLLQEQTSIRNEKNYLEQELKRNKSNQEKLIKNVEKLEKAYQAHETALINKQKLHQQIDNDLKELLREYKKIEKVTNNNKNKLEIKTNEISTLMTKIEKAQAKKNSLEEMQENYAGYYAGVRSVMKQKDKLHGIIGTVAELIYTPSKYMLAIDTVLGSSSQFIVVEDEKSGREAINFLKNNKQGRATFLPQNIIHSRNIPKNIEKKIVKKTGYVGVASELVENDENLQNIIDNLLGQTIIATTLEAANEIARSISYRNRVVSLDGDIINAGGSMTGGGRKNNTTPIFSQKTELEEAKSFILKHKKLVNHLIKEQSTLEYNQQLHEKEIMKIRENGENKRLEEQQVKNELESFTTELDRIHRELKVTKFEASEARSIYETNLESLSKNSINLDKINEEISKYKSQIDLLNVEQEDLADEKEKNNKKIQSLFEDVNQNREELATIRAKQEHLQNQITQNKEQIEKINIDIDTFDDELEVESKEDLYLLINQYRTQQEHMETKQEKNKQDYKQLNNNLSQINKEISALTNKNKKLTNEKSKLDIKISKNDVRVDHNLDYLVEEYKISYEEAKFIEMPTISFKEAEQRVNKLKKNIEELGSVNLDSISEFKEINERYEFLTKQQNDLIYAKETLLNTMQNMDEIVEKQFETTFNQIKEQFAKVFPKMFGGGHAKLVLEEPDNLLKTGIEIIAQPPGKKLANLSLLSGGERALTAISLLFAIIQVNPIPFCILDEAEAALDDTNVVRFGNYLKNFEDDTQFIVITHRKGTMEHSDQLYGVTMQEKGVSKIVAVTLNEAQKIDGVT